jgi:hypothetical protein
MKCFAAQHESVRGTFRTTARRFSCFRQEIEYGDSRHPTLCVLLEDKSPCKACGKRGADVRPDFGAQQQPGRWHG